MTSVNGVRILVGYDGSDDSVAALTFAATEAVARGGVLHLVYAVDDTVLNSAWGIVFDVEAVRNAGQDLLDAAREQAHGRGVPLERIETECVVGQPAAVLSKLSETSSLVVVGRRAESGPHAMFVGSTAAGLAGTAGCPVIMTSALNDATASKNAIGVGFDPGARGTIAVEWALKRARRLGATVRVVTVVKRPTPRLLGGGAPSDAAREKTMSDVRARVQAAVDAVAAKVPGVQVAVEVRYGCPIDELVALSQEVDLLIGSVHPVFPTYSLGGVVRGLMAHGACTLGLVRYS